MPFLLATLIDVVELKPFVEIRPATWNVPVIFVSPHSGRHYQREFFQRTRLDKKALRSTEDAFVDLLFADAPKFGAPLICAQIPRAFIDLNRGPDELDPVLIAGFETTSVSRRSRAGYGVIPRLVARGQAIYQERISRAEAASRIAKYHVPFHERIEQLMNECVDKFGEAILFDCHSSPHEMLANGLSREHPPPNVVLGDRHGRSCGIEMVKQAASVFASRGLKVARNHPFSGAYTLRRHGAPSCGRHVLQIELDRRLYLNEAEIQPNMNFQKFRRTIREVIAKLGLLRSGEIPIVAE